MSEVQNPSLAGFAPFALLRRRDLAEAASIGNIASLNFTLQNIHNVFIKLN